jgi:long-subunit acyl-CoA synthetase (AMP-forming)
MNYHQLFQGMRSVASGLRKRGFQTGDKLVVIGSNFIEIPLMSLAVWRAGGSQACLSVNLSHGNQIPSNDLIENVQFY